MCGNNGGRDLTFNETDEKLGFLVDEGYYEPEVLDQYPREFERSRH